MRKLSWLLTMLTVLSLLLAVLVPVTLADEAAPVGAEADANLEDAVINWTPAALTVRVAPGETEQARAAFTSRRALARAHLVVSFPLSRYVRVEPHEPFPVVPGAIYPVHLTVGLPDTTAMAMPPVIVGTIAVVSEGQIFRSALLVTLVRTSHPQPVRWAPSAVRLSLVNATAANEVVAHSSAAVSYTTAIMIENARLRATPPLNRVLDLSEAGPVNLVPGVRYTLAMTAHLPIATAAIADIEGAETVVDANDPASVWVIVNGVVEVFNGDRVYAKTLPVTVVLGRRPALPVVYWRPAIANFRMTPGETARQVVMVTSNMAIENATLMVSGPIFPLLTASFAVADPVTLLPHTPYPVTLVLTSPPSPALNRVVYGEVSVANSANVRYKFDLKVSALWHQPRPTPTPTAVP